MTDYIPEQGELFAEDRDSWYPPTVRNIHRLAHPIRLAHGDLPMLNALPLTDVVTVGETMQVKKELRGGIVEWVDTVCLRTQRIGRLQDRGILENAATKDAQLIRQYVTGVKEIRTAHENLMRLHLVINLDSPWDSFLVLAPFPQSALRKGILIATATDTAGYAKTRSERMGGDVIHSDGFAVAYNQRISFLDIRTALPNQRTFFDTPFAL